MKMFFLGSHMPHWLGEDSPLPRHVPLCVSRARLAGRKSLPRARGQWLMDSRGFSTLNECPEDGFSDWDITPHQYVREVRRYRDEIGHMVAAAPMDWMCESWIIANTGLSAEEHLRRSVWSLLELRWLAADLKIFPVLQGDAERGPGDHLRCAEMFERAGIDLTKEPLVGVGSVCRIQRTDKIIELFVALQLALGPAVRLHGFGVKTLGLAAVAPALYSADSQAWSRRGREVKQCRHGLGHVSEANCPYFALEWYERVLAAAARATPEAWNRTVQDYASHQQGALFDPPRTCGPNRPTFGQTLERATRVLQPEGGVGEWSMTVENRTSGSPQVPARHQGVGLAAALDAFRDAVTHHHTTEAGEPTPTLVRRAAGDCSASAVSPSTPPARPGMDRLHTRAPHTNGASDGSTGRSVRRPAASPDAVTVIGHDSTIHALLDNKATA